MLWVDNFSREQNSVGGLVLNEKEKWMVDDEFLFTTKFVDKRNLRGRIGSAASFVHINASLLQNLRYFQAILNAGTTCQQRKRCLFSEDAPDAQLQSNENERTNMSLKNGGH